MNNSSSELMVGLLKFRLKHRLVERINVIIASNSMFPYLQRGDEVFVVDSEHYEVGDVIAYAHWEKSITIHRIVRIENNKIYTKGDNNPTEDEYYITKDEIVGKVRLINDV